jgi:hypothetical protein
MKVLKVFVLASVLGVLAGCASGRPYKDLSSTFQAVPAGSGRLRGVNDD